MENSVKALYMGAGMLLGVMILSVWVYLFRQGAALGQHYDARRQTEQTTAFNSQFDQYAVVLSSRNNPGTTMYPFEDISNNAYDVITCASLAYNINTKNDFDSKNCVEVIIKDLPGSEEYYLEKNTFITNSGSKVGFDEFLTKFNSAKIIYDDNSNNILYKYYFDVRGDGLKYFSGTGRINKITFTCREVENFDNPN